VSKSQPVVTCTRRIEWDSAHRVLRHESKCATLHGHRYAALITCAAPALDVVGRVVDFGLIREVVGGWVDLTWDHTTIVGSEDDVLGRFCEEERRTMGHRQPYVIRGEPTAENIALELLALSQSLLDAVKSGITVMEVTVYETPNCSATARRPLVFDIRATAVGGEV
jgi:6-pyruvoyltetrahydropterin/6-carboxytetrahydropterin synthase